MKTTQKVSKYHFPTYSEALKRARSIQSHTIGLVDELMLQDDRDAVECLDVAKFLASTLDEVVHDHSLLKGPSAVCLISTIREVLELTEAAFSARLLGTRGTMSEEEMAEFTRLFEAGGFDWVD